MGHADEDWVVYEVELASLCAIAASWDRCRVYHLAALEAAVDVGDVACFTVAMTRLACMFSVS